MGAHARAGRGRGPGPLTSAGEPRLRRLVLIGAGRANLHLLHALSRADLGMYYVFLNLGALLPVVDASLSLTVSRAVSYAMAGATTLQMPKIR